MSGTLIQPQLSNQRGSGGRADARWAIAVCGLLVVSVLLVVQPDTQPWISGLGRWFLRLRRTARLGRLVVVGDRLGFYRRTVWRVVSALDAFPHARLPALRPESGRTPPDQPLAARRVGGGAFLGSVAHDRGCFGPVRWSRHCSPFIPCTSSRSPGWPNGATCSADCSSCSRWEPMASMSAIRDRWRGISPWSGSSPWV